MGVQSFINHDPRISELSERIEGIINLRKRYRNCIKRTEAFTKRPYVGRLCRDDDVVFLRTLYTSRTDCRRNISKGEDDIQYFMPYIKIMKLLYIFIIIILFILY